MNILKIFVINISIILLMACGGSDSKPTPEVNKAPVITTKTTIDIESGDSISLSATVSDPENDSFKINWQADNANVTFSNNSQLSTLVTFPETNVDLIVTITIVATDNEGHSSKKNITVNVSEGTSVNKAPIITLASEQHGLSGQNIVLVSKVHDPEGDEVSVEWSSGNNDIIFSEKQNLTTSITLPNVDSELTTSIILTAIDDHNNQSEKILSLTIKPIDSEPEPTVIIELLERFDTVSGEITTINARLTSNVELDSVLWDLTSINVTDSTVENTTQDGYTLSKLIFTAPEVNELTEFPIRIRAETDQKAIFYGDASVFVAADNTKSLTIDLPQTYEVSESTTASITPVIESSHAIDSYQWRWLSEQPLTLLTPTNKVLSFSVPAVDSDINGQLELTVVMGSNTKIATTELTIINQEEISDVNVTASKLILVKGQVVTLNVITDNLEQIKSWSWEASGVTGSDSSESKSHFEITAPEVNSQQNMAIIYRATLIDDSEVMKIANVTVLSESEGRSSFTFDAGNNPIIYNDIEKSFSVTFVDPHGLVDSISLDQSLTSNLFNKAEITRGEGLVNLVLKTSSVVFDHTDFISLDVKFGAYRIQYPMQLDMRVD